MKASKHRWLSFSVRELFLFVLAIGCALGWLQEHLRHGADEGMTVGEAIEWLDARDVEEREIGSQLVGSQWYRYILRREPIKR